MKRKAAAPAPASTASASEVEGTRGKFSPVPTARETHTNGASMSIQVQQLLEDALEDYGRLVKANLFVPDHLTGQLHDFHLENNINAYDKNDESESPESLI